MNADKPRAYHISTFHILLVSAIIIIAGAFLIGLVNYYMRHQALVEAKEKAQIILDHNLAIHTYFSHDLKPKLFTLTEPAGTPGYFEPACMSSTFAIRKIQRYFSENTDTLSYDYKECAVNARSPENEADDYEKAFINELKKNSGLEVASDIRMLEGKPYLVVMRRGEVMEQSCLRCHSTPDRAPLDLVQTYGPTRSFNRQDGELASALSIRIPLAEAYAGAQTLSLRLSALLAAVLAVLYLSLYAINRRMLFIPIAVLRDKARQILTSDKHLGERIPLSRWAEIRDLTDTFNAMSFRLREQLDGMEDQIRKRTAELEDFNRKLAVEVEERRQAEEALRQSHQQMITVMDSVDSFMYIADMETFEILFINECGHKAWGDVTGKKCWQSIHKSQDGPCSFCTNDKLLTAAGTPAGSYNWEFQNTASGKWYDCRDKAIQWSDGRMVRMEIATDITDRKRLEEELIKTKKFETMSTFSAGIAHDFNNLMGGVLNYITLSMDDINKPENALKFLEAAEKIIFKAKDVTGEFLTLAGAGIEYKNTTGPCRLIKDAALLSLQGSNIQCEFALPEEEQEVMISSGLLSLIISSVVENSREAMPDGGAIKIKAEHSTCKQEESRLPLNDCVYFLISISDNGSGIPKEHLPRIFDPYYSTKQRGAQKGMGLGLAVVYSIVTRLNGSIRVESQEGVGTEVFIYLPAAGRPAIKDEKKKKAKAAPIKADGVTKRILFMDDEEVLQTTMKIILERAGYTVAAACHGEEALEKYIQARDSGSPFDAVILDLTIVGGMGGKETIKKLLAINPLVRAIVFSGYSTNPVILNYERYGFKGALTKPATRAEIIKALKTLY